MSIKTRLAKLELNNPVSKYADMTSTEKLALLRERFRAMNGYHANGPTRETGETAERMAKLGQYLKGNAEMLEFVKMETPALWAQFEFNAE